MSAPKRTNALRSKHHDRIEWLASFHKNVEQDGTARRAWDELVRAGVEAAALRTLWTYAHPPKDYVKTEQRKARRVNREIKALIRANRIAGQRLTTRDRRAGLFVDRALEKYRDVVRAEMPFANEGMSVADWAVSRSVSGRGTPDLPKSRKAFVSLGPRSPISDRKFWLFVLFSYAKNGGVRLGLERLTALAYSADPDSHLHARTLSRYLASISPDFKAKCLLDFRTLPTPPLIPPKN
jgi:hypothetical protein